MSSSDLYPPSFLNLSAEKPAFDLEDKSSAGFMSEFLYQLGKNSVCVWLAPINPIQTVPAKRREQFLGKFSHELVLLFWVGSPLNTLMYSMSEKRIEASAQLKKTTAQSFAPWVHSWVWAVRMKVECSVIHEKSFALFHLN